MIGSIPTREGEGQKHPEQTGEWHEAWISLKKKCAEFCLRLSVQCLLSAWQHIYILPGTYVTPPDRKWGLLCSETTWSVHTWEKVWLTPNLYFFYLFFPGL